MTPRALLRLHAPGVFLLALAARAIYLAESARGPAFDLPLVDSHVYHRLAAALAAGGGLDVELFWQPLLYPLFLAAIYAACGPVVLAARLVQVGLGATTAVLTLRLGTRQFGPAVGLAAGATVALYGPLVFFDAELLATGWACLWSVALLLLLDAATRADTALRWAAFAFCGALAVLTRPTFLPFVALGGTVLALRAGRGRGEPARSARRLAALAAGFLVVALPVASLTRARAGRFSILPASGGINLYIGNNPDADATLGIRPGWDWSELTRLPQYRGVERRQDTSRFFRGQFLDYVRSEPLGFAAGLGRKTLQLVSSRELPRNVDVYVQRQWSALLSVLVWKVGRFGFPFGVLLPLALVGVVRRRREVFPALVWFLVLYAGSVVAVFVSARYRAPLIPPLAILAAAGTAALAADLRARRWGRLAAQSALMLGVALAGSLPGPFPQEAADYEAELYYGVGARALERGALDRAEGALERALARRPDHAEAHNVLGNVYFARGRHDLALEQYRAAVELDPRNRIARDNLGRSLLALGRYEEAVEQFRRVLRDEPGDAAVQRFCGVALLALGRAAEAVEHLERARTADPADVEARVWLGRAWLMLDRPEAARDAYAEALRMDRLERKALDGLADALLRLGRPAEAAAALRAARDEALRRGRSEIASALERRLAALDGAAP